MSFPKYPAYKDSGVEWIGEIPVGWRILPLKKAAQLITGITPPTNNHEYYTDDCEHGFPWVNPADLQENGRPSKAKRFLSITGRSVVREIPRGSTLVCCIGTIGKTGFLYEDSSTNQQITSVIPMENKRFLFYIISSLSKTLEFFSTGNVLRILNSERLGAIQICLPPFPEQQAIASFLDRECGKIDALIAEQERLIALLAEKRQAVISHAVTKGLNPNAPMKDSGIPWIGMVPEGWEVVKLKRVGKLKGGYAFSTDLFVESGIPVVRMSNLKRGEIDFSDAVFIKNGDLIPSASLSEGDLIWGMSGSIGDTGSLGNYARVNGNDIPCQLNQRVGCFSLSKLDNDFMECIVQAEFFYDQIVLSCTGTAQFNVSSSQVEDCYVVVPPMEDQKHIANFLRAYLQQQSTLYATSEQSITLLKERRAALISAAVTGKIDVRAQSKALAA